MVKYQVRVLVSMSVEADSENQAYERAMHQIDVSNANSIGLESIRKEV
jgi:hypothetical protein